MTSREQMTIRVGGWTKVSGLEFGRYEMRNAETTVPHVHEIDMPPPASVTFEDGCRFDFRERVETWRVPGTDVPVPDRRDGGWVERVVDVP